MGCSQIVTLTSVTGRYFVLPDTVRRSIWESTGLRSRHVNEYTFDYDDFVMKAKEAVRSWVQDQFCGSVSSFLNVAFSLSSTSAINAP